jgi:UDPglucose 6-dehydrogenase
MRISVVGLGKLGAPMLAVLASKGYDVVGLDANPELVDNIKNHRAPVEEPQLQELLTQNKSRIFATTNWSKAVAETDITTIIVPTPSGPDGAFRNDYVLSAIDEIGRVLAKKPDYHLVVVNSTTMPGSVGGPIRQRLEQASARKVGSHLGLCYNPEFIALGDVINGLLHPDFVLIGESDRKAGDLLEGVHRQVVGPQANIARMNFVNAELTKISVNTYVTMKISFANMLGEICDRLNGADAAVVADALGRDTRIGVKYLRPAIGYGGPCFPRDTLAFGRVADLVGRVGDLALATDRINRRQVARVAELVSGVTPAKGTVAVLGLAYKPSTPVVEESQGLILAKSLHDKGLVVLAHDPMAGATAQAILGAAARVLPSAREAVRQADVVVIVTPWSEYATITPDWITSGRTRFIIDCWRQLDPKVFAGTCPVVHLGRQHAVPATPRWIAAE